MRAIINNIPAEALEPGLDEQLIAKHHLAFMDLSALGPMYVCDNFSHMARLLLISDMLSVRTSLVMCSWWLCNLTRFSQWSLLRNPKR